MKKNVSISVIMSEYNTPEVYLRASIQSILNQTYSDFEFIIVDDCGTNDLKKIVSEFNDTRIRIIKNKQNLGLVLSLNKAIKSARGEYIVRMDTDDIALPTRIEKIYHFIQTHSEYDAVGSRVMEFSDHHKYGLLGKAGEKNRESIMHGDILVHPSVIMKKAAIEAVGYYKNFTRAEDLVLWCELLLTGKRLYVVNDVLLLYRVNPNDYKKRKINYRGGEIKARLTYYPKLKSRPSDYIHIIKSIISGMLPLTAVQYYRHRFVLDQTGLNEIDTEGVNI